MSALLKRAFEALGFVAGDYEDGASTGVWLECHGMNGLQFIIDAWPQVMDGRVDQAVEILSSAGDSVIADAHGASLLFCGQKIADLALAIALDSGAGHVELRHCHGRTAILPALAGIAARGCSVLAHWQSDDRQHLGFALGSDSCPSYRQFSIPKPDENIADSLHLVCNTDSQLIEETIRSMQDRSRNGAEPRTITDMQTCYDDALDHGLQVDAEVWQRFVSAGNAVLVESTEQSRQGAGE